jgi:hypothetical protein
MTETDPWLNNMNNCYILFDPERKETMSTMGKFINTKIDPVIILSCFILNTHKYLDGLAGDGETFKINDAFVEEAIKKCIFADTYDKELIEKIRSLVFCGRNITTEAVFIHIWTTIIEKFLADPAGDVL